MRVKVDIDLGIKTKCKYCEQVAERYCFLKEWGKFTDAYCCEECYQERWVD